MRTPRCDCEYAYTCIYGSDLATYGGTAGDQGRSAPVCRDTSTVGSGQTGEIFHIVHEERYPIWTEAAESNPRR